jgi:hypothetical protein
VKTSSFIVVLAAGFAGTAAHAQKSLDAPPPLPAEKPAATLPAASPAQPSANRRPVARLPELDRTREEAALHPAAPATTATGEPPDNELLPPAHPTAPETRIEQIRQGNRIVEIVVTPKGSTSSYVIVNREGKLPLTTQELSSGLSTPRFLRFDF